MLSLDADSAEERYGMEPSNDLSADKIYERRWAMALLDTVMAELREEHEKEGKPELFEKLKPCLAGSRESQPYAQLGTELGMSEGAVKVAVHRFRQRYRELLRRQIAHTVSTPEEIDEEIRHLFSVLG